MSTSLINLTEEYKELLELVQDPEVDEQTLLDTMEAINGEISVKCGAYIAVMNYIKSRAELFKNEAKRLNEAAKAMENNIARMKERIKYAMEEMGVKSLESEYNTLKIVANGGVQPLKITGEVPDSYKKVILENDNDKIRKDLKDGIKLDFAQLEERGTHLRIS